MILLDASYKTYLHSYTNYKESIEINSGPFTVWSPIALLQINIIYFHTLIASRVIFEITIVLWNILSIILC